MNEGSAKIFLRVRNISTGIALGATVLALLINQVVGEGHLGWQVVLALVALALGIPHGAIDHLISLPTHSLKKLIIFITGYVALAVISGAAIFQWNVLGFQIIVLISFLHFGFGDASFLAELRTSLGQRARTPIHHYLYAITSGALPVLLPLTSDQTKSALQEIQPAITNWAGSFVSTIRITLLTLTGIALLYCAAHKEWRDSLDLIALLLLSLLTPPLVAFGIYFGCWHAARHTARLTSLLPSSKQLTNAGRYGRAYLAAIYPGLPALVGACALALVLVLKWNQDFSHTYFWNLLVIVWALTVPHMMATARFDREFLAGRKKL
jgi:Brp/Blh family beta-carotene 15,15'-monooxygenase